MWKWNLLDAHATLDLEQQIKICLSGTEADALID